MNRLLLILILSGLIGGACSRRSLQATNPTAGLTASDNSFFAAAEQAFYDGHPQEAGELLREGARVLAGEGKNLSGADRQALDQSCDRLLALADQVAKGALGSDDDQLLAAFAEVNLRLTHANLITMGVPSHTSLEAIASSTIHALQQGKGALPAGEQPEAAQLIEEGQRLLRRFQAAPTANENDLLAWLERCKVFLTLKK